MRDFFVELGQALVVVLLARHAHEPVFFFFNDPAPPEIYTLSLHDALPICPRCCSTPATTSWGPTRRTRTCSGCGIATLDASTATCCGAPSPTPRPGGTS